MLLITSSLLAQERVGLVLSGGGAKGLAHIGVIKALEENEIPIDFIVGTSMGAVVGAFYAAGYSPEEIENIVRNPAFQNWVIGTSSEYYQYNYTKAQDNASWNALDLIIDLKNGPQLNTPLANDLVINFVLNEYLTEAAQAAQFNFDKLLVPYRAIAADVFTQKTLSLDSGSIMKAVRSSMAVPFFYRPIKQNNQYLFDGGIYDNFPVDIMNQDFNPDIIIGSNVASKLSETYPFDKDEEILNDALLFMFLDKTNPGVLKEKDIYIEPNIQQYSAIDFKAVDALIDSGYNVTLLRMPEIKEKIAARKNRTLVSEDRNEFRQNFKPYNFNELRLFGFTSNQEKFVRKLIEFKEGPKNLEQVSYAYFQLVSEPYFKNVYPNFNYDNEAEHYILELYLKPTAKNSLTLGFGGNISSSQISTLQIGAELNSFNRKLNTHKFLASTGRFYEAVNVATRFNINPKSRLFWEPSFQYNHWNYLSTDDLFDESVEPIVLDRTDRKLGLTIGLGTGQRSVITFENSYIQNTDFYSNFQGVSSDQVLDDIHLSGFKSKLAYERNSLNNKQFPNRGSRFYTYIKSIRSNVNYKPGSTSVIYDPNNSQIISSDSDWLNFFLSFDEFKVITNKYTIGWSVETSYSTIKPFTNFRGTMLYVPAYEPMFDSNTFYLENFRSPGYLSAGIKNIWSIRKSLELRWELYAYSPFRSMVNIGNQEAEIQVGFKTPQIASMLAFVYRTLPGPISLRLNYIEGHNPQFNLMLSFGYLIFNERSQD